jgi:NAD(P)-dependent dehydrogenase (short-subunit alcohol dehydrogenase family)
MAEEKELAGKVALVTGGARNICRSIALTLAQGGSAVITTPEARGLRPSRQWS